ncbi:MAG: hypothetical protein VZS44_09385 [Bacilli bacterium]|nr:hypothetical protein [Bacilli bacterium]
MKKINWRLLGDITTILTMIVVLIGFLFLADKLKEYKERIKILEVQYRLVEQDLNDLYEIDPGIRVIK